MLSVSLTAMSTLALTLGGCPMIGNAGSGAGALVFDARVLDAAADGGAAATMAADLNGDNLLDLVSVWKTLGEVRLHIQDRPEGFIEWNTVSLLAGSLAAGAQDVAIADIDLDGRWDVIVATSQGRILYLRQTGPTSEDQSNWQIDVIAASQGVGLDSWTDVEPVDIDGDDRVEIVATCSGSKPRVCIFDPPVDPADTGDWIRIDVATAALDGAIRVLPVDIDADADFDLVTIAAGEGSDSLAWYANPGAGVALTNAWVRNPIGHVPDPRGAALAYINQDGVLDLVVSSGQAASLWWFEGPTDLADLTDPTKRWPQYQVVSFGTERGGAVNAHDLDGDQATEIVAAATGTGKLSIYKYDPVAAGWAEKPVDVGGGEYGRILIVDLDMAGKPDIVSTTNADTSQVVWYQQR
jgi:hypothetical protein